MKSGGILKKLTNKANQYTKQTFNNSDFVQGLKVDTPSLSDYKVDAPKIPKVNVGGAIKNYLNK